MYMYIFKFIFFNFTHIKMYQNSASNMVLGCFIGVMILLAIMIILLAVADHRVSSMLTNQNNQMNNLYKIGKVLGAKHLAGRVRNN